MAENALTSGEVHLPNVRDLLWGSSAKEDVFRRWAQGFYFSKEEPTALVQAEGGPCAVIAPVQAFLLKELLSELDISTWKTIKPEKRDRLLLKACKEIIKQAAGDRSPRYTVVHIDRSEGRENETERAEGREGECDRSTEEEKRPEGEAEAPVEPQTAEGRENERTSESKDMDSNTFHARLRIYTTDSEEDVEKFLLENFEMLTGRYGVLLLLYSVVCTKGVHKIWYEMSDATESMIESTYGYGSQSLINLMLTGRAVSHVWDHDQHIGGLKLRGIDKQNVVGFLALLEHLRYCEVGTFLKSPSHPVWVLGSETHLTVLFSTEKGLVSPETPADQARRIFRRFDPEGNGFIPSNLLQDLLAELGLVADKEYVDIMRKKLDGENLGIILRASFMDEFFPEERWTCPDTFPLYHYNGLPRSNPDNVVRYHRGQAVLLECTVKGILYSSPMQTVLQTKWPRIEIQWDIERNPSLN